MEIILCFDSGICGILKMKLPSVYQVFQFQENLALGNISCCECVESRADTQKICYYDSSHYITTQASEYASFFTQFAQSLKQASGITIWLEQNIVHQISSPTICNFIFLLHFFPLKDIPVYYVIIDRHKLKDLPNNATVLQSTRKQLAESDRLAAVRAWGKLMQSNKELRIYDGQKLLEKNYSYYDEFLLPIIENTGWTLDNILCALINSEIMQFGTGFIAWRYSVLKNCKTRGR